MPENYKPIIRTRPDRGSLGPKDRMRLDAGLQTSGERKKASGPTIYVEPDSPWPRRIGLGVVVGASLLALAWSRGAFGQTPQGFGQNHDEPMARMVEADQALNNPAP